LTAARMRSGESMRDVLQHNVPLVTELRSATRPAVQRWRSASPPSRVAEALEERVDLAEAAEPAPPRRASAAALPGLAGPPAPSRRAGEAAGAAAAGEEQLSSAGGVARGARSPRCSPRASPRPSPRALSPAVVRASSVDPRAKPRPPASLASEISGRRGHSPRAARDHLWRELFHDEADEQQVPRLKGAGQAIGRRGRASTGMPWRQIPSYDRAGAMGKTGDPHAHPACMRKSAGWQQKAQAQFSDQLGSSIGMRDVLDTVQEGQRSRDNCENSPPDKNAPPLPQKADPREAWLDVVKRRCAARAGTFGAGGGGAQQRQQKQPPPGGAAAGRGTGGVGRDLDVASTKDSCPFFRDDSIPESRAVQGATPHIRCNRSPSSNISVPCALPAHTTKELLAERVVEARRDFEYSREKASIAENTPRSSRCDDWGLQRSDSLRNFSAQTRVALSQPVHAIRASPATHSPKWKKF